MPPLYVPMQSLYIPYIIASIGFRGKSEKPSQQPTNDVRNFGSLAAVCRLGILAMNGKYYYPPERQGDSKPALMLIHAYLGKDMGVWQKRRAQLF